jgi:nitroreductase
VKDSTKEKAKGLAHSLKAAISDRWFHDITDRLDGLLSEIKTRFKDEDDHVIFRQLPEARPMTMSLTEALSLRKSRRTFSDEPLSDADLATLLWAADGITHDGGKRTTPSALDWQEIDIYVLKSNGIWHWVPEKNGLIFCELKDIRSETIIAQPTIHIAPAHIVYVANRARTESFVSRLGEKVIDKVKPRGFDSAKIEEMRERAMTIDVGAKIQAVYLAAATINVACVARTGFDRDHLGELLHLSPEEKVIAVQTVGYAPHSIADTFL